MTVDFNDIEILNTDAGGGNTYFYNNQPFTGLIVEYNNTGILIGEITVFNGSKKGRIALYFDNGQIQKEYFQSYNRPYGISKQWDENGNLMHQHDYGPEYQP
ncbi:antitoxin component YwqK of YwqJK toxin-antitoxin module [Chryseobacterium rhizosphaerae]|uniref:hypothetical protein n=1 Tax=Chryseobacterium rhizosphaerae TaxID=395937 RepID=UPI00285CAD9C|nr:hypothetical protein [Chryseobacterium rhizosphaerae]MDR6546657.1 antitoxin component YwqK of YwqJK toxin-antitoxin module [Chryseobacterium rhizosphaerae]